MIPWLGHELVFPPVRTALAEPDGLLAAGGDLSPARLLLGYSQGIFPWFSEGEPILWWSPAQRMVLFPSRLRVSRSLDKTLRNRRYRVTLDSAFRQVMEACAAPRAGAAGTWIIQPMVEAYCRLHQIGAAHSFEVWMDGELVGGLYGVALGRMFYGESMFSRRTDASKIAFVHMARHLQAQGVDMIDCQMYTPHLASLGATLIPRAEFIATLKNKTLEPQADSMWNYCFDHEPS
ncbi:MULTISPECIES: leucyl/phenylalanyl-tRNA--protein transferase [Aquitalea]|uniref:Leucyl/phenylalanyl-tRNA--protein transferase n=1 Tax=Aquitalea magnusonii TaxID=332411 RepID=A0A318JIZ1_9NEIS|nr:MULTISPECIES: leucyl/phenylalanyl-tRNA--protein transferase [Aquitalea]PXX49077.1 leucyl/phenylalanyl-tRNA--protein transferase [Aquitalea magnusonii]